MRSNSPLVRIAQRLRAEALGLWERAQRERSTPRELGLSVAVGAFAACTPFLGFHLGIAFGLATLFRLNRLWAMVGSRLSITPVFLAITFCEIQVAHRLTHRAWLDLAWRDAPAHARALAGDWLLGTVVVGVPIAALVGTAAWMAAVQGLSRGKRDAARPPSSGSPP